MKWANNKSANVSYPRQENIFGGVKKKSIIVAGTSVKTSGCGSLKHELAGPKYCNTKTDHHKLLYHIHRM